MRHTPENFGPHAGGILTDISAIPVPAGLSDGVCVRLEEFSIVNTDALCWAVERTT